MYICNLTKHFTMNIRSVYILLLFFLLASCGSRGFVETLDEVESVIYERPDSALQRLRTLDPAQFGTKSQRARYSLLHAMALDKNYIDTTDVSVVMPAVEYYRKHGTADQKMKAWYYLGRIQYNADNLNAAAVSFAKAERVADGACDVQAKGLLYMAFSDIYNKTRNRTKEEEYVRKGINAFETIGDEKHGNLSSGRLAIIKFSAQEWHAADSLFKVGIDLAKEDTVAMSVFLSNYARMKVLQPEHDPYGAIELLKSLSQSYKRPLSLRDYGVWAYAASLTGDEQTCEIIEKQLKKLAEPQKATIHNWLYRIEKQRGNYEMALNHYIEANANNSRLVDSLLSDSVGQTLQNYYSSEVDNSKKETHIIKLKLLLVLLGCCLFFLVSLMYLKNKKKKREREVEQAIRIGAESNKLLRKINEDLQGQLNLLKSNSEELESALEDLRKTFVSTYKDKFTAIGELCSAYMDLDNRVDKKDYIIRRVEHLISYISDDEKQHARFEQQINKDLNNIVKHLKADLGVIDKKESRFICYCIVGFEPEMIGSILGLSLSNVYTKKSRLREKIRNLESPYKDEYLRMI